MGRHGRGKGRGGKPRKLAVAKLAPQQPPPPITPITPASSPQEQPEYPAWWRLLLPFLEHPFVTGSFFAIGGVVGTLFYAPLLILSGVGILLAFHRVGVVKTQRPLVQILAYAVLFLVTFSALYSVGTIIHNSLRTAAHNAAVEIAAEFKRLNTPKSKFVPDPDYPTPKGPLVRMEGTVYQASSTMCQNMSDEDQNKCLCPVPLDYALRALPTPSDNNYSTEIDIKKVDKPVYRLRIFSRGQVQHGSELITVPPIENSNGSVAIVTMTYDPFSLAIHSTAPKDEFKIDVHSSEGLRLRCINQEN